MGVIFFSSTALSIGGKTPLPVSADGTDTVIIIAYIVSALVIGIFQQHLICILRALMCVSLAASLALYAPFSTDALTTLFYIQAFCCVFMICGYMTVAITRLTPSAELKRIVASMVILGATAAVIQSDAFDIPYSVFNAVSCLCQIFIIIFLFGMPAKSEITFACRSERAQRPKMQIFGLLFMASSSGITICFSNAISESVPNGLSVFYLSLIAGTVVFRFLIKKLQMSIMRVFRLLLVTSSLGFVLALSSYAVKPLIYFACAVLGFSVIIGEIYTYYGIFVFNRYPAKTITPAIIAVTIPAAGIPMLLLDAFRENTTMLYAIYCIITFILLVAYTVLEPYFSRELNLAPEAPDVKPEIAENEGKILFPQLSEQENNLAMLLLQGYTESAVCEAMNITINTQKSYRKSVYLKLGIHSKRELFELAGKIS